MIYHLHVLGIPMSIVCYEWIWYRTVRPVYADEVLADYYNNVWSD